MVIIVTHASFTFPFLSKLYFTFLYKERFRNGFQKVGETETSLKVRHSADWQTSKANIRGHFALNQSSLFSLP
ncbi:hypothetical protein EQV77_13660 [Halobacillus fulvus]|nr:hypothetical protein EQV77_13660 [Halobacillus fulvus]